MKRSWKRFKSIQCVCSTFRKYFLLLCALLKNRCIFSCVLLCWFSKETNVKNKNVNVNAFEKSLSKLFRLVCTIQTNISKFNFGITNAQLHKFLRIIFLSMCFSSKMCKQCLSPLGNIKLFLSFSFSLSLFFQLLFWGAVQIKLTNCKLKKENISNKMLSGDKVSILLLSSYFYYIQKFVSFFNILLLYRLSLLSASNQ